ncbi:MAG: molybdenum cofactor biosynthesis protein, partial [Methanobacteriota archaeon]
MRPLRALVSLDDAMRMLSELATPIERRERVPLLEALHRVAARDVVAGIDVPLADRAAMDGYAVRASDTYRARKFTP